MNIGKLYVTSVKYPHRNPLPVVEKGWTYEIDEPWRKGSCLVFRLPCVKQAVALGIWGESLDEETALSGALWSRELETTTEEIFEWE